MKLTLSNIRSSLKQSNVVAPDINKQSSTLPPTENTQDKSGLASNMPSIKSTQKANVYAEHMRINLGQPMENGIALKTIATKSGDMALMKLMQLYAQAIDSKLGENNFGMYINIGERLVDALNKGQLQKDGTLLVQTKNGDNMRIQSNLETARSISWYMLAKALMDNASPDREPTLLQRGSMLMKDDDGKLFRFLNSAPNSYGRISSHFNERSASKVAGLRNTGVMGKACGLSKPSAAQRGIEDFAKRLPGGKGTMLFDQLTGKDGSTQLFLKWETAGMPTVFGKTVHADKEEGIKAALRNHTKASRRCAAHAVNFVSHLTGSRKIAPAFPVRREDLRGEATKKLFEEYKTIAQDSAQSLGAKWSRKAIKEGKERGLYHMKDLLLAIKENYLSDSNPSAHKKKIDHIDALLTDIRQFESEIGNDLGLERKGSEVHVSLDTSYLTSKTLAELLASEKRNG